MTPRDVPRETFAMTQTILQPEPFDADSFTIPLPDEVPGDSLTSADSTWSAWQDAGPLGTALVLHPEYLIVAMVLAAALAAFAIRKALRGE